MRETIYLGKLLECMRKTDKIQISTNDTFSILYCGEIGNLFTCEEREHWKNWKVTFLTVSNSWLYIEAGEYAA